MKTVDGTYNQSVLICSHSDTSFATNICKFWGGFFFLYKRRYLRNRNIPELATPKFTSSFEFAPRQIAKAYHNTANSTYES